MKQLNTLPIEDFLEKAKIAVRSNQKSLSLSIKEVADLQHSLSVIMARLLGKTEQYIENNKLPDKIEIKMDGGKF